MSRPWIRRTHRWVSLAFTAISAAIFLMLAAGRPPAQWVYYLPLPPLALLVLSGIFMFFAPYAARRAGHRVRTPAATPS